MSNLTIPSNVPPDRVVDFDMYNPPGIEEGYHEAWKRFQDSMKMDFVWTPHNGGHWIATSGAWVRDIYRDYERFTSEVMYIPKEVGEKYDMIPVRMDPPEHTPFRVALNKCLGLREIRALESTTRDVAISLIEQFRAKGQCEFSSEFAQTFPVRIFIAMANVPSSDLPLLMDLTDRVTRPKGDTVAEMAACVDTATKELFDYVTPLINERRAKPGGDLISVMVNTDVGGRQMTLGEAQRLITLVLMAGLDTTVNFLSFVMIFLGKNPEHRKQLASDPSLIPRAVEELFRRFPVVAEARMVRDDVVCDDVLLKKGDMVLVPTAFHGLDERVNECPMQVNFQRKSIQHSTFGDGPHRCAGLHLARMEVTVTLQEWFARIPEFKLADNAKPVARSSFIAAVENVPLEWAV